MDTLTQPEQQLLQIIQSNFPVTEKPYAAIGKSIGKTEHEVIETLRSLKKRNIIRQISAIFNGTSLGFKSTLISFQVQENTIDDTANIINSHPGVSHNYKREHSFNLWFTLSIPQNLDIERHAQILARMASCTNYLYLPSVKMFKRHVQFDMTAKQRISETTFQPSEILPQMSSKITLPKIIQCGIMKELQQDLPLSPTPFKDIAKRFQVEEETFFSFLHYLKTSKKMSRFAGILKHRNLGFTANAMVVWEISENIIPPFVDHAVTYPSISHCYERVTYPEWPYNIYTMIHGRSREITQKVVDELSSKFGITRYEVLYSSKEYKKQRVDYFSQDTYEWDKQNT